MDAPMDFGPCCACEGLENVRNMILLDKKAPVSGFGWGCFVCHIPNDGACAVICDQCLETKAEIRFAIYGEALSQLRIGIEKLTKPFGHDMRYHQADLELSDEYDDFEGEHGNWLAEDDCN